MDTITITREEWGSRWPEIAALADRLGVPARDAIIHLIYRGLAEEGL
jgi:hypothetical protein